MLVNGGGRVARSRVGDLWLDWLDRWEWKWKCREGVRWELGWCVFGVRGGSLVRG